MPVLTASSRDNSTNNILDSFSEQKKTVLFVDDEESILEIVAEYFTHKGYHVLTAPNGVEALKVIVGHHIDCCFTDINMPEMTGLELAERLRAADNTIPVVIMTGYPSLDNTIRTLRNGVVDFLIKPVNLSQMELCLKRVLRERELFIENVLLKEELESKSKIEQLNKELVVKIDELNILNQIMSEFAQPSSSRDIFRRIVDMAVSLKKNSEAKFYIINEEMHAPCLVASSAVKEKANGLFQEAEEQLVIDVLNDGIPLLIPELDQTKPISSEYGSFMLVPLKIREKIFGVLTLSVPKSIEVFNFKELYYLSFIANKAAYSIENLALYENIYENLFSTLYAFVSAIEAKDTYTQMHSKRVAELSIMIGKEIGCTLEELEILNVVGQLHDIGKIGIRDEILLKPGKLTDEEYEIIKQHPGIGANIVGKLGFWNREMEIIRYHHEKYDGTGYPEGLKREEIPFLARIISVADSYDAMASNRAYRNRLSDNEIMNILKKGSGTQFDPGIVGLFISMLEKGQIKND